MGRPTREDDVEAVVPSTTTMMTTVATTTATTGGAAEMPEGVGNEFEAPLERDETEFGPSGGRGVPPVGIGIGRGWEESERRRRGWTIIAIPTGKKSKRA
jgi:hypothetical protein